MSKTVRNYGFWGPGDGNRRVHITKGQLVSGATIGIMVQDVHYPLIPGNVVNADTYTYPVRMEIVPGANQARMHTGDETLLPSLIETAEKLVLQGCRAIVGACGYFGHFQKGVADSVDVPVYLSSIVQVPWIRVGLKDGQKIGIICADRKNLTERVFDACGVSHDDQARCRIIGAGHLPEFSALLERRGHFDNGILKDELIQLSKQLIADNPDIGALLLECSDMPPYSAAIQAEINLPVYDFITMIDYLHSVVAHKPYYGFM
ncbi:MAG: aspartate/glutamate racemase family protein [Clostridiaceae bacterium]|nr:aspartate/glutamate racemase family protein [Clostridiaceae bacterium]